MTKPITLKLDPDAADLLERATGGRRTAGDYLSRLLRERWQEWTEALDVLRQADWRAEEILAACDALNGYWAMGSVARLGGAVAHELMDAQDLNDICAKWDVDPKRWRKHAKALRESSTLTSLLLVVVREFWTDNQAAETAVRGVKPRP